MGLEDLKKLEFLFLTAGEEGIFCKVSIVRSDNDGLGIRDDPTVCVSPNGAVLSDVPF